MIVEEGGWGDVSDDYCTSLTPRGVQYGVFFQMITSASVTVKGSQMALDVQMHRKKWSCSGLKPSYDTKMTSLQL